MGWEHGFPKSPGLPQYERIKVMIKENEMENQKLQWLSVLWSSALILLLPLIATIVIVVGFGLVVGFQTRGDQELVMERQIVFQQSAGFQLLTFSIVALVIFWRTRALSKRVTNRLAFHIVISVALGVAARILLWVILLTPEAVFKPLLIVELLLYIVVTYIGILLAQKRQRQELK
jgi:hypothetical protein